MLIFSDNINFSKKNFKSLYHYLDSNNIKYQYVGYGDKGIKKAWGNYLKYQKQIRQYKNYFFNLSNKELYEYTFKGINLWQIIKGEISYFLMQKESYYNSEIKNEEDFFNKIYIENFDILIDNFSAAIFWLNFWENYIDESNVYVVFSNGLIYTRVLSTLLDEKNIPLYVTEHFFTGNDFYFDRRYTHLPNNFKLYDYKENIPNAWNKFITIHNKNVKQPSTDLERLFSNKKRTILLLTQVVNDFSVLLTDLEYKSTIVFYKKIIDIIMKKTDNNLIIKTHPYENYKNHKKEKITYHQLHDYIMFNDYESRIKLVDNYNIDNLIMNCDIGIVLNSQSAFDLLRNSKPVITLGNAFYSGYGFTYDYTLQELEDNIQNEFTFNGQENSLYTYIDNLFYMLVNNNESYKIENILSKYMLDRETVTIKKSIVKSEKKTSIEKTSIFKISYFKSMIHPLIDFLIRKSVNSKKYRKFNRNPELFFKDSKKWYAHYLLNIYKN